MGSCRRRCDLCGGHHMYLPLETMSPLFLGGLLRHYVDTHYGAKRDEGKDQGVLLSSGYIAGEGMAGVLIAVIAVIMTKTPKFMEIQYPAEWMGQIVSAIAFGFLGYILFRVAKRIS